MAKFCENEFEQAVLEKFENNSWEYLCGYDIRRELNTPILKQDLRTYLDQNYDSLSDNEFDQVVSYIAEYSNQSLYRALKETYKRLFKGFDLLRDDGSRLFINFFDFGDDAETNNIFRVVNSLNSRNISYNALILSCSLTAFLFPLLSSRILPMIP